MLTLITPTSDRPRAFALCEKWMARQTFKGEIEWLVADDGRMPVECTMGQTHLVHAPKHSVIESFLKNLLLALEQARFGKILFIEDDDWYHPEYLETMSRWLDSASIVGEGSARYYHLPTRRYHVCKNRQHASLCQTGIRNALIPRLIGQIETEQTPYVDINIWKLWFTEYEFKLNPETSLSCGIKGLPGKHGIGMGHRLKEGEKVDTSGEVLASWVGREDAELYFSLEG